MIVICYGMPKSASTFTMQLTSALVACKSDQRSVYNSLPERVKSKFYKNTRFIEVVDQTIYDLVDAVSHDQVLVIKTHSSLSESVKSVLMSGNALGIVNYRNPYDIIVSLKDAGERERLRKKPDQRQGFTRIKSIDDAKLGIKKIIKNGITWLDEKLDSLLYIPYESIEKTPFQVASDINIFLQLNIDSESITTIVNRFINDKSRIGEYNVGVSGRGAEISFNKSERKLVKEIDSFIDLYLKNPK